MLAAYIGRLPVFSRVLIEHAQHGGHALIERAVRTVGLQLVVLDEVDAGFGEHLYLRSGLLRRHADTGLDDGADHRTPINAGEPARSLHAELRTLIDA